jgi:tensin
MESWLKADAQNVAVVHCMTGKGRTSTVVAAFLCWVGEAGFNNVQQALTYIDTCKKLPLEQLTIPSQRCYVQYFTNMLDGVRPSQPPLMLKRVLLSEAPKVRERKNDWDVANGQ